MTPAIRPRVDMHYRVEVDGVARRIDLPFTTLVLADLAGTPLDFPPPVAERRFAEVDADSFDRFMHALAPRLILRVPNRLTDIAELKVELHFRRLDDFAPRAVMRQVPALAAALEEPARERVSEQLDAITGDPAFMRLEAAWRSLWRLVAANEPDGLCPVRVMTITKADLWKSLKRFKGSAWDQSPIFKRLYGEGIGTAGADPAGCIVADFEFDHSPNDIELLGEMAKIAAACQAPLIAAAAPGLMQMNSWQELTAPRDLAKIFQTPEYAGWRSLRDSEDAAWLVLTLPRYLERQPWRDAPLGAYMAYSAGAAGDAVPAPLYANAAYLLAAVVQRAFRVHGWFDAIQGLVGGGAVDGLPADGGADLTEQPVDERRVEDLARVGLTALVPHGATDTVLFGRLATLVKPLLYDDDDATRRAAVAARLQHRLALGRVLQFVRRIASDSAAAGEDAAALQARLQAWIEGYCERPADAPDTAAGTPRPLARAEVIVEASESEPGHFKCTVTLHPKGT